MALPDLAGDFLAMPAALSAQAFLVRNQPEVCQPMTQEGGSKLCARSA